MAADELKPAYLVTGTDAAKIDATIARLRSRADREGGAGALEVIPSAAGAGPDPEALARAMPAMTLIAGRRFLLADGVERWTAKGAAPVLAALKSPPPDLTVVLVSREEPPKVKAPKALGTAVEAAGGEVLAFEAPKGKGIPSWLVGEAARRGFRLDAAAAWLLAERMGEGTARLSAELDRLATWAEEGGSVELADLEAMIADTSEEAGWTLGDAVLDRDPAAAVRAAERLRSQGEATTPLIYGVAKRLRDGHRAVTELERGRPRNEVEASLQMHPYAAKLLVRRVSGTGLGSLRAATCAFADLEWWTRGGSDYPDDVALTLALLRAASARG